MSPILHRPGSRSHSKGGLLAISNGGAGFSTRTAALLRMALPLLLVAAVSSLATYYFMHSHVVQQLEDSTGRDVRGHPLDVAHAARHNSNTQTNDPQGIDGLAGIDDAGTGGSRRGDAAAEAVAADALAAVAAARQRERRQQLLAQQQRERSARARGEQQQRQGAGTSLEAIKALEEHLAHVIHEQHLFGADDGQPARPHHFGLPGPGRPRIALVNHAPYHLEIVAGMLHLFQDYPCTLVWYQAGQASPGGKTYTALELLKTVGFVDLVGGIPDGVLRSTTEPPEPCDFAVFVSPEYFLKETKVGACLPYFWGVRRRGYCVVHVCSRACNGCVSLFWVA